MKNIKQFLVNESRHLKTNDEYNEEVNNALDVIANYFIDQQPLDGSEVIDLLNAFFDKFPKKYDKMTSIIADTMRDY